MGRITFINNSFVEESEANISVKDLSIQRGYGVFDFFRLQNNKPLFLEDHLQRFYFSASQMRLPIGYKTDELKNILQTLIQKNNLPDSGIRLTLTGGNAQNGYSIASPNLIITQSPVQIPTHEDFEKGIRLLTYPHQRQLPHVKSIDYLMAIWLQDLLKEQAADEVLYHQNGIVTECPRANFFITTKENKLVTPAENILKGVSRKKIIALAKNHYQVEERPVTIEDVQNATEAFICSTTKLILPVVQINNTQLNTGKPGPVTRQLSKLFINCTLQ